MQRSQRPRARTTITKHLPNNNVLAMHGCTTRSCVQQELGKHKCNKSRLAVWQRGVDTDQFHPKFRCRKMRARMTDGNPDAPLLIHVGRLGAEKNLFVLKDILAQLPGAHLAFVGDGPSRQELEDHFADMPNVKFMVRNVHIAPCLTACQLQVRLYCSILLSWSDNFGRCWRAYMETAT